jgi:uncharacterized protein YtpQ (UPF0354 family)
MSISINTENNTVRVYGKVKIKDITNTLKGLVDNWDDYSIDTGEESIEEDIYKEYCDMISLTIGTN